MGSFYFDFILRDDMATSATPLEGARAVLANQEVAIELIYTDVTFERSPYEGVERVPRADFDHMWTPSGVKNGNPDRCVDSAGDFGHHVTLCCNIRQLGWDSAELFGSPSRV